MDRALDRPLIAVVEDNEDNCVLLHALLDEQYHLVVYTNGPEALERLRHDRPALVLLDVSLPGMDGLEVLRRLRASPTTRDLPVIALTAHAMAGDRERILAEGFDDYLSKPILDEHLLFAAVARLLVRSGPGGAQA